MTSDNPETSGMPAIRTACRDWRNHSKRARELRRSDWPGRCATRENGTKINLARRILRSSSLTGNWLMILFRRTSSNISVGFTSGAEIRPKGRPAAVRRRAWRVSRSASALRSSLETWRRQAVRRPSSPRGAIQSRRGSAQAPRGAGPAGRRGRGGARVNFKNAECE